MKISKKLTGLTASAAILALAPTAANAQGASAPTVVNATLDSVEMVMGQRMSVKVEVLKNRHEGVLVNMPDKEISGAEVRQITVDSTEVSPGRYQLKYDFVIQPFDPGVVSIPPFRYAYNGDTVSSKDLTLKVNEPMMPREMRDSLWLNPMEGTKSIKAQWYDFIPSWWYWVVLGALAIALGVLVAMLYKKNGPTLLPRKKVIPPHVLAFKQLENLKKRKLAETGHEKEYYTELTDIFRQYLEGRFGIYAREMSTTQILEAMSENGELSLFMDRIDPVLRTADFVKFAKVRPLVDENVRAFSTINDFVTETAPADEPEEKSKKGKKLFSKKK